MFTAPQLHDWFAGQAAADELDDAPPELHPFKTCPEDRASDWAADDLRATARALDLMLADVRAVVR